MSLSLSDCVCLCLSLSVCLSISLCLFAYLSLFVYLSGSICYPFLLRKSLPLLSFALFYFSFHFIFHYSSHFSFFISSSFISHYFRCSSLFFFFSSISFLILPFPNYHPPFFTSSSNPFQFYHPFHSLSFISFSFSFPFSCLSFSSQSFQLTVHALLLFRVLRLYINCNVTIVKFLPMTIVILRVLVFACWMIPMFDALRLKLLPPLRGSLFDVNTNECCVSTQTTESRTVHITEASSS